MDYEDEIRKAARRAEKGIDRAVASLQSRLVSSEPDLTGVLKGNLDAALSERIGSLTWHCTIVNHGSGRAAEEKKYGADLLIHVRFSAPNLRYDKGVLIQSKRVEPLSKIASGEHNRLIGQCQTMLSHSPAAFVFVYSSIGMRADSATKIVGSSNRYLYDNSPWTAYRFFLELFRCPIGDTTITSPYPGDLDVRAIAKITAEGG